MAWQFAFLASFPGDSDSAGLGNHTLGTTVVKEVDKRDTLEETLCNLWGNIFKRGSTEHATAILI